jgi:hypothetical protein
MELPTLLEGLDRNAPLSTEGSKLPMPQEAYARAIRRAAVRELCAQIPGEEQQITLITLLTRDPELRVAVWWIRQKNAGKGALQATLLERYRAAATYAGGGKGAIP